MAVNRPLDELLTTLLQDSQPDESITAADIRDVTQSCHPEGFIATPDALSDILGFDEFGNARRGPNEVKFVGMSGYDTQSQTQVSANTALPITIESTEIKQGLTFADGGSVIVARTPGVYLVTITAHFTSSAASQIETWLEMSLAASPATFVQVPHSAMLDVLDKDQHRITTFSWPIALQADDSLRAMWAVENTNAMIAPHPSLVGNTVSSLHYLVEKVGDL